MFTSKLNTMTGKMDWEIQSEDYDYQQELARAGFADMLHDLDRNVKYFAGLKKVIAKLKLDGKKVHVLDIGTGTGLLSMMAVHCGADKVTACEAFEPMIKVAKECIASNGMTGRIEIIEKRSTDIEVGVGKDMSELANVLVTEVFDTELIGEGAISTFNHALDNLLTKDCYVIPDNAIMYVQVIDSPFCHNWNWLNIDTKYNLKVPTDYSNPAGDSICDLQLDQFDTKFTAITKPVIAFKFSFSGKQPLPFDSKSIVEATGVNGGKGHAVLMWWVCHMDWENEILMSCAPKWANHAKPEDIPWRDHWMQAVYFPKSVLDIQKGERLQISCNHDEYSLWFDLAKSNKEIGESINSERSLGNTIVSRNRLGQINDTEQTDMFMKVLKNYESLEIVILIANDDLSLLSVIVARNMNFKHVYVLELNRLRKNCLKQFIEDNELSKKVTIVEKSLHELELKDFDNTKIDYVFSEMAFTSSHLPWENLYFYYGIEDLQKKSILLKNDGLNILPFRIRFYAIAVQFTDLHKIRSPVVSTCGFKLSEFDKVILEASKSSDGFMEPHPLWEYPCIRLSEVVEIFKWDCSVDCLENTVRAKVDMEVRYEGVVNGVVMWQKVEFDENDDTLSLNTGLLEEPIKGKPLIWSPNYKQAVQILDKSITVSNGSHKVNCIVDFDGSHGKFDINFKVIDNAVGKVGGSNCHMQDSIAKKISI